MSSKEGMGAKLGDKVFVVAWGDNDNIYFLGFGVYESDEIPNEETVGMMASLLRMREQKNPKLVLDNGDSIWGCECYWGPTDQFRSFSNMRKIVPTTIAEYREQAKPKKKETG